MAKASTKNRAAKAASAAKVRPAPKPKAEAKTVAKPTVAMHNVTSDWTGPSDVANSRVSRTRIDLSRFNTLRDAPMTERDNKALAALRSQFAGRQFERGNLDAGILRRLGERGYVEHVSGGDNDANATFRLTSRKAG